MCSKDEKKQQSHLFISTAQVLWNRFGRVWFAVVPCGTLIGFSLFCFSSKVPVYVVREGFLSAVGTGASWECLCLMRLTYRLMTENCSGDSSSLSDRASFLLRNDIVEVEERSLIRQIILFFSWVPHENNDFNNK